MYRRIDFVNSCCFSNLIKFLLSVAVCTYTISSECNGNNILIGLSNNKTFRVRVPYNTLSVNNFPKTYITQRFIIVPKLIL